MKFVDTLLGALGMYIYLRSRGVEPPPELLTIETRLRTLVPSPAAGIPAAVTEKAVALLTPPTRAIPISFY